MKTLPTLRQLQYLLQLHETMNFSRAAELCHVTQPTLSAAIQEMENLLGLPVLDRSRRKHVVFTAFGLEVIETAKKIMPHLYALSDKAKQMSQPLSGPMRLGLIPTIAPYLLPKILPVIQKKFLDIDFHITEDLTDNLVEKLQNGKIDVAILAFPYDTPGLSQSIFFEEPFYCAGTADSFKKQKITLKDLEEKNILLLEDGHCLRDHALSACKLVDIHNTKTLSATSLQTLVQMVAQGYGITLLPEMFTKQGLLPKNVKAFPFQKPVPTRKIGAAWRTKDPLEADILEITGEMKRVLAP